MGWCGHCKRLEPIWNKLAGQLNQDGSGVRIGKVDATKERSLARRFDLRGFPTLKMFSGGEMKPYKGSRTEDALYAYAKGGHKSTSGEPVPGPLGVMWTALTWVEGQLMNLEEMLQSLQRSPFILKQLSALKRSVMVVRDAAKRMPRILESDEKNEIVWMFVLVAGAIGGLS